MTKQEAICLSEDRKLNALAQTASFKEDPLAAGDPPPSGSVLQLLVCVGGIYISFLTWAVLQERITTTSYGPDKLIFRSPLVLNTVQSLFASITGFIYFMYTQSSLPTTKSGTGTGTGTDGAPKLRSLAAIFPSKDINLKLLLVAVTQSLASPFGYASLKHIDYITFILAKSCKLLPVMFLHLTIFRRSYPFYKYAVVASVTAGVAVFTLYHPNTTKGRKGSSSPKGGGPSSSSSSEANSAWGLLLLSVNLLFDGLTNSMQDHIFAKNPRTVSGPQMMTALNFLSSVLTLAYLPFTSELGSATRFIHQHPRVLWDIIGFSACGALGQVFIFHTLAKFGSLVLVTVTVTRKMFSMILSVVMFGHRLSGMQWVGVGMVFGGVGAEAEMKRRGEVAKREAKRLAEGGKKVQ